MQCELVEISPPLSLPVSQLRVCETQEIWQHRKLQKKKDRRAQALSHTNPCTLLRMPRPLPPFRGRGEKLSSVLTSDGQDPTSLTTLEAPCRIPGTTCTVPAAPKLTWAACPTQLQAWQARGPSKPAGEHHL